MLNETLRKRVIRLFAMSYGRNETDLWQIYEKIGDINILLNLLETNELDKFIKENSL